MPAKTTHTVGIIMNGVTGRMGLNQHLLRSIVAIMKQGGVQVSDTEVIMPNPLLVGRNPSKLEEAAELSGIKNWTTDLDRALANADYEVYFDAQTTPLRYASLMKAIKAGKHIYCEKPSAMTTEEAYDLYTVAEEKGIRHGVVQDKLWLPGLLKLRMLKESGFFGKILSVRGEFGYWVFEGSPVAAQRPSWNYRKEEGGGIIFDMFCHWRYLLDGLFGGVKSVSALGATHIGTRWDEQGKPYRCTADDAAYAMFQLENDVIAQFNSSWTVRVRRDDLLMIQVDGTKGSAVAGLRECWIQPYNGSPRPVWNPDIENPIDFRAGWITVPQQQEFENAFKVEWELFLGHVVKNDPFPWTLLEGARGVQLAEKAIESWSTRKWIDIPELKPLQKRPTS
jgi:predicted dehydrogenase